MHAVILKKHPFSEGNEIITMFTRELGKVRAVGRAVKSSRSKLAFGLQSLFLTDVDLVEGKKLWTVKGVRPVKTFKKMRENEHAVFAGLYGAELILKSTADEQPHPELYDYFVKYLEHLDSSEDVARHLCAEMFVLHAFALLGYGLSSVSDFPYADQTAKEVYSAVSKVDQKDFKAGDEMPVDGKALHKFVEDFTNYILERNLASGQYLV